MSFPTGPAPQPTRSGDHVGVHEQKNSRFYIGAAPDVGRVSGAALSAVADLAQSVGSHRIWLTPYQKLLVLDVPVDPVSVVVTGLRAQGHGAAPGPFRPPNTPTRRPPVPRTPHSLVTCPSRPRPP